MKIQHPSSLKCSMSTILRHGLLFVLMLAPSLRLAAQQRDTLYQYETHVIHDTIIVRDTIYQYDTLKIRHQEEVRSTTNEDNPVKNTLPAKADTSAKAVETPVLDEGLSQKKDKKKCERKIKNYHRKITIEKLPAKLF